MLLESWEAPKDSLNSCDADFIDLAVRHGAGAAHGDVVLQEGLVAKDMPCSMFGPGLSVFYPVH